MKKRKVMQITNIAILISLSLVLNMIVFFRMPQGGSVTLHLVPLLLISKKYGAKVGILASLITSTVNMLLGSSVIGVFQVLLDYYLSPLFIVLFSIKSVNKKIDVVVILLLSIFSLAAHVLSGILYYDVSFQFSVVYNISYFIPLIFVNVIVYYLIHDRIMKFF